VSDVQSILDEFTKTRPTTRLSGKQELWALLDKNALAQALLDARTEAVALRATEENLHARIAALEAGPTDAQCLEIIDAFRDNRDNFRIGRDIIRAALARPTPEREDRRPWPPPHVLIDAHQDVIHRDVGVGRPAQTVRAKRPEAPNA